MSDPGKGGIIVAFALLLALAQFGCSGAEAEGERGGDGAAQTKSASRTSEPDAAAQAEDSEAAEEGEDEKKEEAVPVEVAPLARGRIESVLRFSSNLEAESRITVVSEAKRMVTRLLVEEGDTVAKGQLLLRLQDDEQRSALDKVKSQLAKAEREYSQQQRLFEQELISQQAYNDATYELEQLQIALADAERELGYTEVRAPIAGTVVSRMISLGDQVQIGQQLFEIVDFDSIVARVFVPEKHLAELRSGLPARISTQAGGEPYVANVERISPVVDPRSGTVKVTIDVGGQPGLRPGMYVDVDLVTSMHADAVLVPKRALVYDNDQVFVYRLTGEERVERIYVEPRLTDKFHIEPVAGLSEGDRIVVAGQAGLKDGALIRLPGAEDTSSAPSGGDEPEVTERASL